jgi:hypothetical protein
MVVHTCDPSYLGDENRRIVSVASPGKLREILSLKTK